MKPTTTVYWSRAGLGVLAGLVSALIGGFDLTTLALFNGISLALLIYIITYYIFKSRFLIHFEKPSKIFTTGIGAYFLTWIVMFGIFFTLLSPTLTITNPASNAVFSPNDTMTIVATITNSFGTPFSGANTTAIIVSTDASIELTAGGIIQLTETSPGTGTYSATYVIPSNHSIGQWNLIVAATINGRPRGANVPLQIQAGS
jgi:hypothetical protein